MPQRFVADPSDVLDYGIDWSDWLNPGTTITTSTWSLSTGLSEQSSGRQNNDTKTWVIPTGMQDGQSYELVNTIQTSDSLTTDRTIYLIGKQR